MKQVLAEPKGGKTEVLFMATRYWLRDNVELEEKVTGRADLIKGTRIAVYWEHGRGYVDVQQDVMSPAVPPPDIPPKFIKNVTYAGSFEVVRQGDRIDGIYEHKGATARLQTTSKVVENVKEGNFSFDNHSVIIKTQSITISANSLSTLKEIYRKIRQGELRPKQDWEAPQTTRSAA